MQAVPMIAARDVATSARWYARLLDAKNDHGGDEFDRIVADGRVLLMLHHWGATEHGGALQVRPEGPPADGVLLWMYTDRFDALVERARAMGADVRAEPHANPHTGDREITIRDPDGYWIAVAEGKP